MVLLALAAGISSFYKNKRSLCNFYYPAMRKPRTVPMISIDIDRRYRPSQARRSINSAAIFTNRRISKYVCELYCYYLLFLIKRPSNFFHATVTIQRFNSLVTHVQKFRSLNRSLVLLLFVCQFISMFT